MEETFMLKYLCRSRVPEETLKKVVIPHLRSKGFKKVEDLEELELKFLDHEDISDLDKNRILKLVSSKVAPSVASNEAKAANTDNVYIRYIFCGKGLFSTDISDIAIEDIDQSTPLVKIVDTIHQNCSLTDQQVIELYSSEGYPLHNNNEITSKESLIRWGFGDGDLVYVFVRCKDQKGQFQFATLPKVDHDIGEETFSIESPFHSDFKVNAYIDSDSPEDIAQKIYSITDIPVPYMTLFVRKSYEYERLTTFTELEDEDTIRVVLRNPQEVATPRSPHYGGYTYQPMVPQSKLGLSKFYSILKFLCSPQPYNKEYDFEKLLAYLMNLTNLPPLVHALRTLRECSYLTIPGWTALVEGCYFLFKTILNDYLTVVDDKVFEYSDYMWSLLINMSKSICDVSTVECEQLSLVCPLSDVKMCIPVRIANVGPFDKANILAKINKAESFKQFGMLGQVSKDHLDDDELTARLLMYYPWENDKQVFVWAKPPQPSFPTVCKKTGIQTSWNQMISSLTELSIVHPLGLYAGSECLTYIENGHLAYFLGAAKGTDDSRRIYDPICTNEGYIHSFSKADLLYIGSQGLDENVSHNLTVNLKTPISYSDQLMAIELKSAIIQPQRSIQWEPEEAIVVVLDRSSSMRRNVFSDMSLRRIDAAKELFNAFATRTQAYKLHHSFGLIIFNESVTTRLHITQNVEDFEKSLHYIEPGGGTSITNAVINAVDQLKKFSCVRRILCLTDGENNSGASYSETYEHIRRHRVVVDTVLLTSYVTKNQKNLSHASGGVCVLPTSMREALRFFEMDSVLSLKERYVPISHIPGGNLSNYSRTQCETEDSFTSKYVKAFNQLETVSAKSYIDQDRSSYQLNVSSCQRRIMRELQHIRSNPMKNIKVYPCESEYSKWKVLLKGPEDTAYENGAFVLSIEFPDKYPTVPPHVRFLTPIYHCNISSSSGRICHSIFGESYIPSTSMKEILCYVYGLLMSPEIDSPLDSILAEEYGYLRHQETDWTKPINAREFFGAADTYFKKAKQYTAQYANKTFDNLDQELSGY